MEEMLQAAREGSAEAFGWLYKATYNRNYYIVLKMVKQEQDAMDILQETYVKVFQNLSSFQYTGEKSFGSWTAKIASNTALDFLRKKQPLLFSDLQADGAEDEPELEFADESVESQPELALDQKETSRIVQEMLECLSEEQRICMMFRYIRQMKISEIARECSCSENTVKSRLNYAKKRLSGEREALEQKGIRLYNVTPFAALIFLLQEDAEASCAPVEILEAFDGILNQAFGGQDIMSFYQKGMGKVSVGAKTAAGHGVRKAAAVASLLAAGAGGFLLHSLAEQETPPPYTMETEDSGGWTAEPEVQADSGRAPEADALEEPDRAEEQIYYEYLNKVLIPQYGLADLQQEGTMTMDHDKPDSRMSKENEWFEPKGIVSAYIDDLDLDGQKELFVIYWEKQAVKGEYGDFYELAGAIYEAEEDRAVYKDKMKLSTSEYDWERHRESVGNFCVAAMEAEGRKYLLAYKTHLIYGAFSDGASDIAMWMAEYKDGKAAVLQEARISEISHDPGDIPYVGVTYEGGEEKTELLYAGWKQPEKGPYPTLKEAFTAFFRRKGLDVSEIVEHVEEFGDENMGKLTHTEQAASICTLNSIWGEHTDSGRKSTAQFRFEGTDWTDLREHTVALDALP